MDSRRRFLKKTVLMAVTGALPACASADRTMRPPAFKTTHPRKALVLYYSQTGHTRRIGRLLAATWKREGVDTIAADIRNMRQTDLTAHDLIAVGCPVFYYDVPENLRNWLTAVPRIDGTPFAVFVTCGGRRGNQRNTAATLAELLSVKGGIPSGMASYLNMSAFAPTWSMFGAERTLRLRHLPDEATFRQVREDARMVLDRVRRGAALPVEREACPENALKHLAPQALTKLLIGRHDIDGRTCIRCGVCVKACPVGAIDLAAYRVDSDKCIACMGCVNNCPVQAVTMQFLGKKVYGWNAFLERQRIRIAEPEELIGKT